MQKFDFAIVSPNNHTDVIGVLTGWGKDLKDAMKRVRSNPDMEGVRFYPTAKPNAEALV